ncbi:MAG: PEGA domain-containing protein [Myxococcota bacterium]|nr:PEGA domain-containing protein [Myxococcota bacterium]
MKNVILAALIGLAAIPSVSHAQSPKQQAKALFMEGRSFFKQGEYAKALNAFVQANQLKPHPVMLTNIAKVYEAMEDLPKALEFYRRYEATKPKNVDQTRAKIARLTATIASWPSLNLTTSPAGAAVRIGNEQAPVRGVTPLTVRLAPGRHVLVMSKSGFETKTLPIMFKANTHRPMRITLSSLMPVVEIRSAPPGAQVSFDGGAAVGTTPYRGRLAAGAHTVSVQSTNQPPQSKQIVVATTHTATNPLVVTFAPIAAAAVAAPITAPPAQSAMPTQPQTGQLTVEVDQVGARIQVDGKNIGQSPLKGPITLNQGPHRILVEGRNGTSYSEVVTVNAGQTVTSSVELAPSEFDYKLWAWIGMGTGAALILGGTIAGSMAVSSSGDLDTCRASDDCLQSQREADLVGDVRDNALIADVLLWPGVAIAGAGVLLYLLAPEKTKATTQNANFGIAPTRGGAAAFGVLNF